MHQKKKKKKVQESKLNTSEEPTNFIRIKIVNKTAG